MKTKNTLHSSDTKYALFDTTMHKTHSAQHASVIDNDNVLFAQKHNKCNNPDRGHINMNITFIVTLMKATFPLKHGIFVVVSSLSLSAPKSFVNVLKFQLRIQTLS